MHTLGTLLSAGEDRSWKVRLCFAKNFEQFALAFGKEITDNKLIQTFTKLLRDKEHEVKNAAISSLTQCLSILSSEKVVQYILPTLISSYEEASPYFKGGISLALCEMAPLIGKDYTSAQIMIVLHDLLRDSNADVRLKCVTNILKVAEVVGDAFVSRKMLSLLENLSKDSKWQVRKATIELVGKLSIKLGAEVYKNSLEQIYMGYLNNSAALVRETGIVHVEEIGK